MFQWDEEKRINGKKIVSYTSEELKDMRAKGKTKTDWARVKATTDEEIKASIDADPDDFEWDEQLESAARRAKHNSGARPESARPKNSTLKRIHHL